MAGNVTGLHVFQNAISPEPLKYLDDNYNTLQTAINTLNTFSNFLVDTGTPNNLNVTTASGQYVSYADGLELLVRVGNTNTGPATLNVNNMGPKPILFPNGLAVTQNSLVAGAILTFVYSSANNAFQLSGMGGGGALSLAAPFTIFDEATGLPIFTIPAPGTHNSDVMIVGEPNSDSLEVWSGAQSEPGWWIASFHTATMAGQPGAPVNPPAVGCSNGVEIEAGTNANDMSFLVMPQGTQTGQPNNYFKLVGDGSGALGPYPNQIVWDAAGQFTLTGNATLPLPALDQFPDITITNPVQGDVLSWDATTQKWVNAAPITALAALTDVALATPTDGQALTYNATTQRWVNSTLPIINQLVNLSDVHVVSPQPGQVLTYSVSPLPGWVNGTIPAYAFLTTVSTAGAQPGDALTWNGSGWVPAAPGQVVNIPLSGLTDVGITTPLNRQVLTYDAPSGKWINAPAAMPSLSTLPDVSITGLGPGQVLTWNDSLNRWVNSALPGGSVIALGTLQDVNISDPQNNQVLTWDYATARWVNRAVATSLATMSDVTITGATAGQVLTYNGTRWVNGGNAVIAANAPGTALNVYGIAGSPTLVARYVNGTNNPGMFVTNTEATGNTTISFSGTSSANGTIAIGGSPVMDFSNSRNVTINTPGGGTALTVNTILNGNGLVVNGTGGQNQYACWAAAFTCGVSGGYSNGVVIGAGSSGNDQCVQFMNSAQDKNFFVIRGDGSGVLGSGTNNLTWNSGSFFTFNQSTAFFGKVGNATIYAVAPSDNWAGNFNGGTYGLRVSSGSTSSDYSFMVTNAAGSATNFLVNGDGSGILGAGNLTWTAGGTWGLSNTLRVWYGGSQVFRCGDFVAAGSANAMYGLNAYPVLTVSSPNQVGSGVYTLQVINSGSAASCSNGLYIQAGSTLNDFALNVETQDLSKVIMRLKGNGDICIPTITTTGGATNQLLWEAGAYGAIRYLTSAARYKRDVHSIRRSRAREIVAKLRAVSFYSKCENDDPQREHFGLIAEEVAKVDQALTIYDPEGRPNSVCYERIALMLLPLVQELLGMDEPEGEIYG